MGTTIRRQSRLTARMLARVAVGTCLLGCAVSAHATPVFYLEIPGTTGPVDAPSFTGAFDVLSYSFGVSSGGVGHIPIESLDVVIPLSGAGALSADTGRFLPIVYLDVFKDSSSTSDYLKLTLDDAVIARTGLTTGGTGMPEESVDFDYTKIIYYYNTGGSSGSGTCGTNGVPCPPPPEAPEPATLALLSLGLLGVGLSRRRLTR